jgi:acetyltransferase
MSSSLTPFFKPSGVIVVGASTSPEKLGYGVARNLVNSGYQGAIHFVSKKPGNLFGHHIYTDLAEVPDPADLAILIVPPLATPDAIHACGKRGVGAAIIVSSGFREVGPEGAVLEKHCLEIAREHGVRLLGPNCIGTLDTHLPLDTTFLQPPMPARGHIGFVSHSGAFCAAVIDWARGQSFGFSQIASLGNQADVNETDMLPLVASDKQTSVVVMYLEGISDGIRFVKTAGEVTRRKPVIALKVGRFEAGQKAAASHTGALAGSEIAFEAAFEKCGIFRAETTEQMFDWALALTSCPLPAGKNVAVLTNAGGPGVIATDALEQNGLHMAPLSEGTVKELTNLLPPAANPLNPVDMLASASPEEYAGCLSLLLDDPGVDSVVVILPPPPMFNAEDVADAIIPIIKGSGKPVIMALLGSELTMEAKRHFRQAEIATFSFPERAASVSGILARRAEFLNRKGHEGTPRNKISKDAELQADASPEELVAAYGIDTAAMELGTNPNQAASIAGELGFPVVMKIASPDILHKSDVEGILLNIGSEEAATSGYTQLTRRVSEKIPSARIEGVHIQRQIPEGQEVILGMVRDPQFGPVLMFGSGGVEVEGLKDVAFALGPLTESEANSIIGRTWAGRKLDGFRNIPAADKAAVAEALIRLSTLADEHREIMEIEINPLRVLEKGAVAIDVRIVKA